MPSWDGILSEIKICAAKTQPSAYDVVRYKYLEKLAKYTGRNVISYYSGWLTRPTAWNNDINDLDTQGFMGAVNGLDCNKGLDLILHTPGGSPTAAESIVNYLRSKFSDIRVIIPQMAMSAGTMIACSGNCIIMGLHSSLGPVDPQINGIPAYNIINEFEQAKKDLASNSNNISYWKLVLDKYRPAMVKLAYDSIELSNELLNKWLSDYMFSDLKGKRKTDVIKKISSNLNENNNSKTHGRHFNIDFCKDIGLKVERLEDDDNFQDIILSLHHANMLSISSAPVVKIIENQNGKSYIANTNVQH